MVHADLKVGATPSHPWVSPTAIQGAPLRGANPGMPNLTHLHRVSYFKISSMVSIIRTSCETAARGESWRLALVELEVLLSGDQSLLRMDRMP
jgi:hypothetical protein